MKLLKWINKKLCRHFGHRWSDWEHCKEAGYTDGFQIPMKRCHCLRCGQEITDIDMPPAPNCRCWVEPFAERIDMITIRGK